MMSNESKKDWKLLAIALVIILVGSLVANATNTVGGTVTVKDVRFADSKGNLVSAFLYVPDGVTVDNPAPGMLVIGGGDTNREAFANWSLEFARRGYVVLDVDKYTEGYSEGPAFDMASFFGGPEAFRYLLSLDIIDHDNIGLMGHSMGGMAIAGVSAAYPDSYKAMVNVGSSPNAGARNTAVILGLDDGKDSLPAIFGTEDISSIEVGKNLWIYGRWNCESILFRPISPCNRDRITQGSCLWLGLDSGCNPGPQSNPGLRSNLAVLPFWLSVRYGRVCDVIPSPWVHIAENALL